MTPAIVFLDTETTGTGPDDQPWEVAAIRRDPDGAETELHVFVEHDARRIVTVPAAFRIDWATRFDPATALSANDAGYRVSDLLEGWTSEGQPPPVTVIVGANPGFDLRMIRSLFVGSELDPNDLVHYRPVDVGVLAYGYINGQVQAGVGTPEMRAVLEAGLPWSSDALSRAIGVDPDQFERHTAPGDVAWVKAVYDVVTGYTLLT